MSARSEYEETLARDMRALKLPVPVRELVFHPTRKWRFDFAWPDRKFAVEVEGGTWSGGRHTRGGGFEEDCVKYNSAAMLGWRVLRFTGDMVRSGEALKLIEGELNG